MENCSTVPHLSLDPSLKVGSAIFSPCHFRVIHHPFFCATLSATFPLCVWVLWSHICREGLVGTFKLPSLLSETGINRSKCVLGQRYLKLRLGILWSQKRKKQVEGLLWPHVAVLFIFVFYVLVFLEAADISGKLLLSMLNRFTVHWSPPTGTATPPV